MSVRLPDAARLRVLALAADEMQRMEPNELPPALRPFAKFTPAKRARLAGPALSALLESDDGFRARVADAAREGLPELAGLLEEGGYPPTAEPETVAALAYLLRPDGWEALVLRAAEEMRTAAEVTAVGAWGAERERLTAELAAAKSAARDEVGALRAQVAAARAEAAALRGQLATAAEAARRAEAALAASRAETAAALAAAERARTAGEQAERRLRARVADLEAQVEAARRSVRDERGAHSVRLRVLLDALVAAAQGLRTELALPTTTEAPADLVSSGVVTAAPRTSDLAALLAAPRAHLIVDGYNVTKTGYGELPLEKQRARLVGALGSLAARTGAEITVVFDGAALAGPVPPTRAAPRVRVRFSEPGQIADEVIAAYLRAEPAGRVVVVASSDKEVAESAVRSGAVPVAAADLLALLS